MADLNSSLASVEETRHMTYTKPCQLPENVAFEIMKWEIGSSKFDKKETRRCLLRSDGIVELLVYPGAKLLLSASQTTELNAAISSGRKYFTVACSWSKVDQVLPIDFLTEARRSALACPIYDGKVFFFSCGGLFQHYHRKCINYFVPQHYLISQQHQHRHLHLTSLTSPGTSVCYFSHPNVVRVIVTTNTCGLCIILHVWTASFGDTLPSSIVHIHLILFKPGDVSHFNKMWLSPSVKI